MPGTVAHCFRLQKVVMAVVADGFRNERPPFYRRKLPNRPVLAAIHEPTSLNPSLFPHLELRVFRVTRNIFLSSPDVIRRPLFATVYCQDGIAVHGQIDDAYFL